MSEKHVESPAADLVVACPECDTGGKVHRTGQHATSRFRCGSCTAKLDRYVVREAYCTGGNPLREIDPSEVPAE